MSDPRGEPLQPSVDKEGVLRCPAGDCRERLDEPGGAYYTIRVYVSLTPRTDPEDPLSGRLDVGDHQDGDPDHGTFCAACGQRLDESLFEW